MYSIKMIYSYRYYSRLALYLHLYLEKKKNFSNVPTSLVFFNNLKVFRKFYLDSVDWKKKKKMTNARVTLSCHAIYHVWDQLSMRDSTQDEIYLLRVLVFSGGKKKAPIFFVFPIRRVSNVR